MRFNVPTVRPLSIAALIMSGALAFSSSALAQSGGYGAKAEGKEERSEQGTTTGPSGQGQQQGSGGYGQQQGGSGGYGQSQGGSAAGAGSYGNRDQDEGDKDKRKKQDTGGGW